MHGSQRQIPELMLQQELIHEFDFISVYVITVGVTQNQEEDDDGATTRVGR